MSDESEISLASSSQTSSGSEDAVDLSDSDSEGSETSLIPAPYSFEPMTQILVLNTQVTMILMKTGFQICPGKSN